MTWTFKQSNGEFWNPLSQHYFGWSGNTAGKNNPTMQCVHNVGPIPRGKYSIGAPYDSPHTGEYTLPLTPAPENEMCGRSGFKIHGAAFTNPEMSSDGCIILIRPVREQVWNSGDHDLEVIE